MPWKTWRDPEPLCYQRLTRSQSWALGICSNGAALPDKLAERCPSALNGISHSLVQLWSHRGAPRSERRCQRVDAIKTGSIRVASPSSHRIWPKRIYRLEGSKSCWTNGACRSQAFTFTTRLSPSHRPPSRCWLRHSDIIGQSPRHDALEQLNDWHLSRSAGAATRPFPPLNAPRVAPESRRYAAWRLNPFLRRHPARCRGRYPEPFRSAPHPALHSSPSDSRR